MDRIRPRHAGTEEPNEKIKPSIAIGWMDAVLVALSQTMATKVCSLCEVPYWRIFYC